MTVWNYASMALAAAGLVWLQVRSAREFRRGYLLALDHVESMTGGRLTGKPLPEALKTLREEVRSTL